MVGGRHQEAVLRRGHHDDETHEAAQQRREFRAQENSDQKIGDGHGKGGKDRKFPNPESFGERLVLAEKAGQERDEDQRNERTGNYLDDCRLDTDHGQEIVPFPEAGLGGKGLNVWGRCQTTVDSDQNRRAGRPEGDRSALDDEARHDGGHGRKSQAHEERNGDRRGSSETRGTLDKGAEEPGNNNDLDPTIGGDVGEAAANDAECAAFLEGVQQKDGPKDDVEKCGRHDEAIDGSGRDLNRRDFPHRKGQSRHH